MIATNLTERFVHLILLAAVVIVIATYLVPAVSERLERVMAEATISNQSSQR